MSGTEITKMGLSWSMLETRETRRGEDTAGAVGRGFNFSAKVMEKWSHAYQSNRRLVRI